MEKIFFCKTYQKNVMGIARKSQIKNGNSLFPAKIDYIPIDCLKKECKNYRACKIEKFECLE